MERGSFFYAADGGLRVRHDGSDAHDAIGPEWREAGLALNPSLDNPIARLLPLCHSGLLLPPEER